MRITKTIELDDNNITILRNALQLIHIMSNASNKSMTEVFDYILDKSKYLGADKFEIEKMIMIDDI